MLKVTFDERSLIINGKREFILSGAFHYFRLPHPSLWEPRLKLMKECGLNAVDLYLPWNYHSPAKGEYDFTEERDVRRVFRLCEKLGLYVIARCGPYACAELYGGGFPAWLLREECVLRCRRQGHFFFDEKYLEFVKAWYSVILPEVAQCQNLILFQIENEYQFLPFVKPPLSYVVRAIRRIHPQLLISLLNSGAIKKKLLDFSKKMATEGKNSHNLYMQELYREARKYLSVPIFHNDVASFGERQLDVDIAAIDDYAITEFSSPWKNREAFYSIDVMEEGNKKTGKKQPLFIAEFQGGWFDMWGGVGYATIRKKLGVRQLDIALKSALAQGASLINIYMFCGGTSWGYLGSPDVYTSYDFAAPISETGLPTRRYEAVKKVAQFLKQHEEELLMASRDGKEKARKGLFFCLRKSSKKEFLFLRNMNEKVAEIEGEKVAPKTMVVLVREGGQEVDRLGPLRVSYQAQEKKNALPELTRWEAFCFCEYLKKEYEDTHWLDFSTERPVDFLTTGIYYGFMWVRAKVPPVKELCVDARHLYTVYLNGRRIFSYDNFFNPLGVGEDLAKVKKVPLSEVAWEKENQLTILVASLGQNKDFEEDARNKRGVIFLQADGKPLEVKVRGGVLGEKESLTPKKGPGIRERGKGSEVTLPHLVLSQEGIFVYRTFFSLEKISFPVQLFVEALSFAQIYLNGFLLGRYWKEKGPQESFYLPEGILKEGKNELEIVVWKRKRWGGLKKALLHYAEVK